MEFKNILFEVDGRVATITMNRPSALNALNSETVRELDACLDVIAGNDDIYAVIVTGGGKAFVAGADIAEMSAMTMFEGKEFAWLGSRTLRKLEAMEKPFIAAVNGFALGGGFELALACDIRIASTKAKFSLPEVGLGVIPGYGGTQRLPRLVGAGIAKELIFTAKMIGAEEAYRIGVANKVVEPDALMAEARAMADAIVAQAPISIKLAKSSVNMGLQCDIDTAIKIENQFFCECFGTEDKKEGMAAFTEKRAKNFQNK